MEKCPVCGATPQDVHPLRRNEVMCMACNGQGVIFGTPLADPEATRMVQRGEAAPWVREAVHGESRICEHCGGTQYCPSFTK
jgi:hypothetical protein